MWKHSVILFIILLSGCIELYEFDLKNNEPTLVVEGFISDKSFNQTKNYPSDGRYFSVRLRYTSSVTNQQDEVVSKASVILSNDQGLEMSYTESSETPGVYYLLNPQFFASEKRKYKLMIILSDGEMYESDWEQMVQTNIPVMGNICFNEGEERVYSWQKGEQIVITEKGINICINLPVNANESSIYYRWEYSPTWIYVAPLSSVADYDHTCWVTNQLYLSKYTLSQDKEGGYTNKLMFMGLYRNERIFEKLSVLVIQQACTERYYRFWNDMQILSDRGGLFDAPPYNLDTNIKQVGEEGKRVSGYFGVVKEQATRWYFSRKDLSYYVDDYLRDDCLVQYGPANDPPAEECLSCLAYPKGDATTVKPTWWQN
ncbi:MAG: DUF4249 domain-containing protein [Cyclobacteriaceae bacterium]|nr:DUF4249 domain-containing protein [Cyclobacteriaceae bacterium]